MRPVHLFGICSLRQALRERSASFHRQKSSVESVNEALCGSQITVPSGDGGGLLILDQSFVFYIH